VKPERRLELRLDAVQLLLAVAVVGFVVVAWLFLRRPDSGGQVATAAAEGPSPPIKEEKDVSNDLTFFDRLEKGDRGLAPAGGSSGRAGQLTAGAKAPPAPSTSTTVLSAPPPSTTSPSDSPSASLLSSFPAPSNASGAAGSGFSVQVFAGDRRSAERLRGQLAARGYPAYLIPAGARHARVRVGDYGSRSEAESLAGRIGSRERLKTWIVPAN